MSNEQIAKGPVYGQLYVNSLDYFSKEPVSKLLRISEIVKGKRLLQRQIDEKNIWIEDDYNNGKKVFKIFTYDLNKKFAFFTCLKKLQHLYFNNISLI